MAVDRVTANSRKSRPTMPPIISSGMNTAISDVLMVRTVKPISLAPLSAASVGGIPHFQIAGDILHDHDGVIHHEAGGDGQRHQGEIVQAVVQQIHHGEGADQGDGHGDAGDEGGAAVAQEEKDHQDDQHRRR